MKYLSISFIVLLTILYSYQAEARRGWQGCCSHHGGITYQCVNGRMLCRDGTLSPSCYCNSAPGYDENLFNQHNTYQYVPKYTYGRRLFKNWIVYRDYTNTFLNTVGDNGAYFQIEFHKNQTKQTGAIWTVNNKTFYISYVFIINSYILPSNITQLSLAFNGRNESTFLNILDTFNSEGREYIYFQPDSPKDFYEKCIYRSSITLNIHTNNGAKFPIKFSLHGFTAASNTLYNAIK